MMVMRKIRAIPHRYMRVVRKMFQSTKHQSMMMVRNVHHKLQSMIMERIVHHNECGEKDVPLDQYDGGENDIHLRRMMVARKISRATTR